jgi:hypothetical protein
MLGRLGVIVDSRARVDIYVRYGICYKERRKETLMIIYVDENVPQKIATRYEGRRPPS